MSDASDRDIRLYEALAVYYEAADPDRAAVLAAYPDLADALGEHFAEQDRLSAMAAPLRPVSTGDSPTMPLSADGNSTLPTIGDAVHYFGDYELIRELARGGMGVVFEARQVSLNRPVALKMILTGILASEDDRRRFRLEAEAVANLDHAHIVPIYEVGEHAGFSYFSMKLIPGGSLATSLGEFIDRPRDAAQAVATIARAVHHAHQRGILHRDLKPSNVLLDGEGAPHVVDFGLAKRTQVAGELTATGAVLGTPAYMAPEQAMGKRGQVTIATDVYGLGAIFYTLLSGKAPFGGDSVIETLEQVKLRVPDPPSGAEREVPRDLQTICLKCLEKDPARRYASAEALAADLERYLLGEPITARRVGRVERAWLWAKRRPAVAALSAATVLAVLVGTLAVIAVQTHANRTLWRKNAELAKTNTLLDQQRSRAEQREQQAIDAVKRFRDAVAEEPKLKNNAELEELRKRLLKEPLAFFKSLREQLQADHDTRPEALIRLAEAIHAYAHLADEIGDPRDGLKAHDDSLAIVEGLVRDAPANARYEKSLAVIERCRGNFLRALRKLQEAGAAYERALAILERLARENPTVTDLHRELAACQNSVGRLLSDAGKPDAALAAYQQARAIFGRLAHENSTVTQFQDDLAKTYYNIGNLLRETGKPSEALAAYERARAIRERLARANPTVTEFQRDLADSHNNIGILLRETGKPTEALAAHEQARTIQERLARENPSVTKFQSHLAASHNNIGLLLGETGKPAEALAELEIARAIRDRLARENPTVTEFESDLAASHNNIGTLLTNTGKPAEALAAYERARAIQERLARENPTISQFQSQLAISHNNIGNLLNHTGKPVLALEAYEQARATGERLARENPTVTGFQLDLAASHNNIGTLLTNTGKPAEALAAYERARAIQERLARENPTISQFQRDLAHSRNNIGVLLGETGKPAEALAEHETARAIRERLMREHPESPDYASNLGVSLNNLAALDVDAGRFSEARDRARKAIVLQKKALATNPRDPTYRQSLRIHFNLLIKVATALGKAEEIVTAQRELEELDATDPAKVALDARLSSVLGGEAVKTNAERLQLAYHGYERKRYAASARLFVEALEREPRLANDRERQHAYNAACAAALAAAVKTGAAQPAPVQGAITRVSASRVETNQAVGTEKPLTDTERFRLRNQARSWLQAELARWAKLFETANEQQRVFIAATLKHWLEDLDLIGVRDENALGALPDDERRQWRSLWYEVRKLLGRASKRADSQAKSTMPNGPDAFGRR